MSKDLKPSIWLLSMCHWWMKHLDINIQNHRPYTIFPWLSSSTFKTHSLQHIVTYFQKEIPGLENGFFFLWLLVPPLIYAHLPWNGLIPSSPPHDMLSSQLSCDPTSSLWRLSSKWLSACVLQHRWNRRDLGWYFCWTCLQRIALFLSKVSCQMLYYMAHVPASNRCFT